MFISCYYLLINFVDKSTSSITSSIIAQPSRISSSEIVSGNSYGTFFK
jgi:hypothetical protein